ncbi:MAG: hypothetical protein ACYC66_15765 [Chloroflexota bacterium]
MNRSRVSRGPIPGGGPTTISESATAVRVGAGELEGEGVGPAVTVGVGGLVTVADVEFGGPRRRY